MQAEEFTAMTRTDPTYKVKHPLLDKVRRCSTDPDRAAAFFGALLWPYDNRVSAHEAQRFSYLSSLKEDLVKYRKSNPVPTCKLTLLIAFPMSAVCFVPAFYHCWHPVLL